MARLPGSDTECDSEAVLTVIGDLVEDVVVWTTGPAKRATDNPSTVSRSRGGSAANVAAKAAAFGATRFVGRVGDDPAGGWLVDTLASTGVDVRVQRGGRTGTVVVVVDTTDGERTMFPDRAAASELASVDPTWLDGTSLLHVPAYGLVTEPASGSILGAIALVRKLGARLSIDVSAVTVVEALGRDRFVALLDELAPEVVLANSDEAAVTGLLDRRPPAGRVVVVKNGGRPALVALDDGSRREVAVPAVGDVRDTTGAGDAFAAGFLSSWAVDADPIAATMAGHRTAAAVLTAAGSG